MSLPCSSSQVTDEHDEQRERVDERARFIDRPPLEWRAGIDHVGRGALAQRVERTGEHARRPSPTATSADRAHDHRAPATADVLGGHGDRDRPGRPVDGTRRFLFTGRRRLAPEGRHPDLAHRHERQEAAHERDRHDDTVTGVEPGGDETELGDEAGERRDPGQAERGKQEEQREEPRTAREAAEPVEAAGAGRVLDHAVDEEQRRLHRDLVDAGRRSSPRSRRLRRWRCRRSCSRSG